METDTMDEQNIGAAFISEQRRSYSYDESFLYYQYQDQQQRQAEPTTQDSTIYRKPPLHLHSNTREGPPVLASRDDLAIGTTVVSPLGRFRSRFEQEEQHHGRLSIPTLSPLDVDTDSVPFDQQHDDHLHKARKHHTVVPGDLSVRPFDEDSTNFDREEKLPTVSQTVVQSRVHGPHRSTVPVPHQQKNMQQSVDTRFRMPAVRVSKPALDAGIEDDSPDDEQQLRQYIPEAQEVLNHAHESNDVDDPAFSPGSGRASTVANPPGSPADARMRGIDDAYEEFGNGSINTRGNTTEEDDSLFDFGEKHRQMLMHPARIDSSQGLEMRSKKHTLQLAQGDETSEDGANQSSAAIALRTQEAWKRKAARERKPKMEPHVSFAANNPAVHRYNETTMETSTLAGASLNSEYTKSMESEVEDAIKDIFLIGSGTGNYPGRRKLKYRPDMRRRLRWEKTHTPDDDTLESDDDETKGKYVLEDVPKSKATKGNKMSANRDIDAVARNISPREEKKSNDADALFGAWNIVESGLHAMGAALGIDAPDDETAMTFDDSRNEEDSETLDTEQRKYLRRNVRERGLHGAKSSIDESYDSFTSQSKNSSREGKSVAPSDPSDLLEYWAAGFMSQNETNARASSEREPAIRSFGESKRSTEPVVNSSKNRPASPRLGKQGKGPPSLDKDLRLIELAIQSARSYHKLRGVVYDESDVDIVTDIKFIVVDLTLPLGLIFQENESGCWVTKVLTDGSAIKKSIQVGDQLAAIDGKSAIRLNVEDIAKGIRQKKSRPFELTFLRYVGPLRPAAGVIEEEGYEIKARLAAAEAEHKAKGRSQRRRQKDQPVPSSKDEYEESPVKEKRRFRFFGRKK